MKILQLIQKRQLRGAEVFASQLSELLVGRGHEVVLVSLFDGESTLPFSGLHLTIRASANNRFLDFPAWKRLSEIVKEFDPDLVQANAGDTLKYAVFSKFFFRWRSKLVFRNANLMSGFIRGSVQKGFNRWLLNRCDYYLSVSDNCRNDLIQISKKAAEQSRTISIGTENFDMVQPVTHSVPASEPIFINVASLVPEKNQIFLIKIFNQYFQRHKVGYLWLVGDGPLKKVLREYVAKLGLADRVRFWGYRKDVISILKASDIFIMPSLIEGLPAAILEALSCRIPVIASAVGGIPEVVKDGVNGFCIEKLDEGVYVERIEEVMHNRTLRTSITEQGYATVKESFSMEKIAVDFIISYEYLSARD